MLSHRTVALGFCVSFPIVSLGKRRREEEKRRAA
jgi:hypothetical protein